jgi:REP element-mobilizing transposase RayT
MMTTTAETPAMSTLSQPNGPLAYFLTFTCYGTWLHGDSSGSVDLDSNRYGTPLLAPDPGRVSACRARMGQASFQLDATRRQLVLEAIQEVCEYRRWILFAAHVRSNHTHCVVRAGAPPERVLNDFKAYASRRLNAAHLDPVGRRRWTRHGSTRYLWTPEQVVEKVHYTVSEQGEPMAVYLAPADVLPAAIDVSSGAP